VFSYPPRNVLSRFLLGSENLLLRLRRKEFRAFVHPPARMLAVVDDSGLRQTYAHEPLVWQIAGFERGLAHAPLGAGGGS
jgi:magnesium-protoporphyrin O-methyltransferase